MRGKRAKLRGKRAKLRGKGREGRGGKGRRDQLRKRSGGEET